jgi:exonuclease III
LNNKLSELEAVLTEKNFPHLVFIAETWFTEMSITTISNSSLHRKDRKRRAGGVCIYVRNDLECLEIPDLNHIERNESQQVWISVMAGRERILVGCVYRPPGHVVSSAEEFFSSLKWVREKIESKIFDSVLICGDFNYPGIS